MVLTAAMSLTGAAKATSSLTPLYSGGATTGEKPLRSVFNSYGSTATGDLCLGLATCPTSAYNSNVEVLYVGVGSTDGFKAFDGDNPSLFVTGPKTPDNPPVASTRDFGPFYGTGTGSSWVPSGTATDYFPEVHFAVADALGQSDITAVAALGYGPAVQVPLLVYPVAINFTPTPGWNPQGKLLPKGSSKVNLSTNSVCGIFSGAINTWQNASITKDNRNKQLGSGAITVVYRHDGSSTTFHFTNGLLNQCGSSSFPAATNPIPEQWLIDAGVTDKNGNTVTATSDAGPPYSSNNNFFIDVFNAKHLPSNFWNNSGFSGVTGGANTNTGVQLAVDATVGAIGYVAPDFAQPIQTGNDKNGNLVASTANIQTYYSFSNKLTAVYEPPSSTAAGFIMKTTTPPSFTGGATAPAANPLNWSAVDPTPTAAASYPFGGFEYFLLYSCYASATTLNALTGATAGDLGLLRWYYGTAAQNSGIPTTDLTAFGYAAVPTTWEAGIKELLFTSTYTKLGTPKQAKTACATVTKGA
jgi:ABC-type phosphate transport system substrate-binding protein